MDRATAKLRLQNMTAYDEDPVLADADLEGLLDDCRLTDSAGLLPDDPDWDPTWDLNFAASKGWDLKAGRVSGRFRFEEDNQVFHRNQIFDHCQAMSKRYGRGAVLVLTKEA
jgi:hypothetical protein